MNNKLNVSSCILAFCLSLVSARLDGTLDLHLYHFHFVPVKIKTIMICDDNFNVMNTTQLGRN